MVSPCTTRAIITITIVLGCTSLSLIENSRRAQGTQIYVTEVNLELKKPVDAEHKVLGEQKTEQGEDGDESSNSDSETDGNKSNNPRKRHLSAFEVYEIVVKKQIRSVTELHALAREQKSQGKTDLAEFILNRVPRVVSDIVKTAWDMENAEATLQPSRKRRMLLLEEAREGDCVDGCDGQWRLCAQEIWRKMILV